MEAVKNYVLTNFPNLFTSNDIVVEDLGSDWLVSVHIEDFPPLLINKSEI